MGKYTRNHFIPKMYLKQWYVPGKYNFMTYEFDHNISKYKKIGLRSHGNTYVYEENLYLLNSDHEKERCELEKLLSDNETKVGKIFEKLKSTIVLTPEENITLLEFIINLRCRNPENIRTMQATWNKTKTERSIQYNFLRNGGTFPEYYFATAHKNWDQIINNLPLESVYQSIKQSHVQDFLKKFSNGKIIIVDVSNSGYQLLTSNFPVVYSANLFSSNCVDMVFPLTPTKAFCVLCGDSASLFHKFIQELGVHSFVINLNTSMLLNKKYSPLKRHQIYCNTENLLEILPNYLIKEHFIYHTKN